MTPPLCSYPDGARAKLQRQNQLLLFNHGPHDGRDRFSVFILNITMGVVDLFDAYPENASRLTADDLAPGMVFATAKEQRRMSAPYIMWRSRYAYEEAEHVALDVVDWLGWDRALTQYAVVNGFRTSWQAL